MHTLRRLLIPLALLLVFASASAQEHEQEQEHVLRTQTTVVLAPTLVKDAKGQLVYGLHAGDFTIEDDGVLQDVQLDEILSPQPVSLVVALQCGGAAFNEFERMQGLGAMLNPLLDQGNTEIAIVKFDSHVTLARDFTRDDKLIRGDLRKLRP